MAAVSEKTVARANAEVVYLQKKAEVEALKAAIMQTHDPVDKAKLKAALKQAQYEKQGAGRTWRGGKKKKKDNNIADRVLRAAGVK